MYKVFVNDSPIIITSSSKKEKKDNFPLYHIDNVVIEEIIYKLRNNIIKGVYLFSNDLEKDWIIFLAKIKVVSAAGGFVLNQKKEILFIYRNNIWDLPKGRIEKGESIKTAAIREVEEECGITNLTILKPLITTYHIYYQDGNKLKETHWFLMNSNFSGELTPQKEEGITKAIFKDDVDAKEVLKNSYKNINLVYDTYKANLKL